MKEIKKQVEFILHSYPTMKKEVQVLEFELNRFTSNLQEKRGYFYIVLNYSEKKNVRKTKWIATGLEVKGNKKKLKQCYNKQGKILFHLHLSKTMTVCCLRTFL